MSVVSVSDRSADIANAKDRLGEIVKPFQRDLNERQRKLEFIKRCIQCIERDDFFQLDELLKSEQASEVLRDPNFEHCSSVFSQLHAYTDAQIERYESEFQNGLIQAAEEVGLSIKVDFPKFFVLKGINGEVDFSTRRTKLGELTIKSFDPKRIVSVALKLKKKFYDTAFEPQLFIDSLFACYQEILKKERRGMGDVVPIHQLYTDYVWSLQSKAFLQNMDKAKFKGYSVEQFAIDCWRFFSAGVRTAQGGYCIRLAPGRGKTLRLIDQLGEERHIAHASFGKSS